MEAAKPVALREEIARLEAELAERKASMPRHSVRPHQLQAIEELEDRIAEKEQELERLGG
jgi:uncharacterized small protein (DUF1192 family)